jgi:hypothetical protein
MTYTVWMHGRRIGDTRFELADHFQRRAGSFQPTAHGLTVLPALTAMFPALLDFAEMCRRQGLESDEDWAQAITATADAFSHTPEGQQVLAVADRLADVQVRDSVGGLLSWESLAISEIDMLIPITAAPEWAIHDRMVRLPRDPTRYVITLTLAPGQIEGTGLFSAIRRVEEPARLIGQRGRGLVDPRF